MFVLGVWAAEGFQNDQPNVDLSESRKSDFLEGAKGSGHRCTNAVTVHLSTAWGAILRQNFGKREARHVSRKEGRDSPRARYVAATCDRTQLP